MTLKSSVKAAGGRYAAIAALTNIPATLFAATLYEVFLVDSDRIVTPEALEFAHIATGNRRLVHGHEHTHDETALEKGRSRDSDKGSVDVYEIPS